MRTSRKTWASALNLTARAVGPTYLEHLTRVTLESNGRLASLSATDLDCHIKVTFAAEGSKVSGAFDPKVLKSLTVHPEKRKGTCVEIEIDEKGETTIGVVGRKLTTQANLELEKQPKPPRLVAPHAKVRYNAARLSQALAYVRLAISKDSTRPQLLCWAIGLDRLVATDGHRVHIAPGLAEQPSCETQLLCSPKLADLLLRTIRQTGGETVVMQSDGSGIEFVAEGNELTVTLSSKLVEVEFPPWRTLLEQFGTPADSIVVASEAIVDCLSLVKRAQGIARWGDIDAATRGVRCTMGSALTIAYDDGVVEFSEEIPAVTPATREQSVYLNARYLAESLEPGEAEIRFSSETAPVLVTNRGTSSYALVMPKRL